MKLLRQVLLSSLPGLLAVCATSSAQNIESLAFDGQWIPGFGQAQNVGRVRVNDSGEFVAEMQIGATTTLMGRSGVLLQSLNPVPGLPAGVQLGHFFFTEIDEAGNYVTNAELLSTPGPDDDSALIWNGQLLLQEGDPVTAAGTPPGTVFRGFGIIQMRSAGGLLLAAALEDSSGVITDALLLIDVDPTTGTVTGQSILIKTGDLLPGMTTPVAYIGSGLYGLAVNLQDEVFAHVGDNQPTNSDSFLFLGNTLIAHEGDIEALSGTPYRIISGALDLNDNGDYCYSGGLGPTPSFNLTHIWKSVGGTRSIVAETGMVLPETAPQAISSLGGKVGPACIDNSGHVLWYGEWLATGGLFYQEGFFVDDTLILESKVDSVSGVLIDELLWIQPFYDMSRNGRFLAFGARLVGGTRGVFLLDRQAAANYERVCTGDTVAPAGCGVCPCSNDAMLGSGTGCTNSTGIGASLDVSGAASQGADTLHFDLTGALPNGFSILVSGVNALPTNGVCPGGSGIPTSVFDGLRCCGGGFRRHGPQATDGAGSSVTGWGPPAAPLTGLSSQASIAAGQTRCFQAIYRELAAAGCGSGLHTSNGYKITYVP